MIKTIGILIFAFSLVVSAAETKGTAKVTEAKKIEIPIFDCKDALDNYVLTEKIEATPTPRAKKGKRKSKVEVVTVEPKMTVPTSKVDQAISEIQKFKYLKGDVRDLLLKEIDSDPEIGFSTYDRLTKGECVVESYRVIRALLTTASSQGTPDEVKARISKGVKEWFVKTSVPTYLRASLNLRILDIAKDAGVWKLSQKDLKNLKADRERLDKLIGQANKAYYGKDNVDLFSDTYQRDFSKIQQVLKSEVEESSEIIRKYSKTVSEIKI